MTSSFVDLPVNPQIKEILIQLTVAKPPFAKSYDSQGSGHVTRADFQSVRIRGSKLTGCRKDRGKGFQKGFQKEVLSITRHDNIMAYGCLKLWLVWIILKP